MVDQLKIDYPRNPIYTSVVWLMFASIVAAAGVVRRQASEPRALPAPTAEPDRGMAARAAP
jgi:hypothetical protein